MVQGHAPYTKDTSVFVNFHISWGLPNPIRRDRTLIEVNDHAGWIMLIDREEGDSLLLDEQEARDLVHSLSQHLAERGPTDTSPDRKLRIYINRKLSDIISPNKRAAHAVHAALSVFGVHPNTKVIVLDKGPTEIAKMRTVIHDAGHTELEPGTLTAGTNWPEDSDE